MIRGLLYYKLEHFTVKTWSPFLRRTGQNMFRKGQQLVNYEHQDDRLAPSLRVVPISDSKYPKLLGSDFVAPNVACIGDVTLGEGSSLWHACVVRGDQAKISIGKNVVIQDLVHIGNSNAVEGDEIYIGDNSFVGANASLDGCTLEPFAYVGMGSKIGKGSVVESFAIVASGAVIPPGTTVKSGQVWAGHPAKYLRDVTQEEKHLINEQTLELQQLSQIYAEETEKDHMTVLLDKDERAFANF